MVYAKDYETVPTFVKVMHWKLWPLFSGQGAIIIALTDSPHPK